MPAGTTHFKTIGFDFLVDASEAATVGTNAPEQETYPIIMIVDGSPNGNITAPKGSLALSTAGSGVGDRLFVNTDGSTTWTAVTTAG